MSRSEAANYLGMSTSAFDVIRRKFNLRYVQFGGNTSAMMFTAQDLDALRQARQKHSICSKACVNCQHYQNGAICNARWTDLVSGIDLNLPPMPCVQAREMHCGKSGVGFVWKTK